MRLRLPVFCLVLISPAVSAEPPPARFDPAEFERRFHQADQGSKGKLTREEAYGEFPRMPKFFDEIDANRDGFITLEEVNRLVEKKTAAAIDASRAGARYGGIEAGPPGTSDPADPRAQKPHFASQAEERHYYRNREFEALAEQKARARDRGEVVSPTPTTPFLKGPL
jgi:hypothetical protein